MGRLFLVDTLFLAFDRRQAAVAELLKTKKIWKKLEKLLLKKNLLKRQLHL